MLFTESCPRLLLAFSMISGFQKGELLHPGGAVHLDNELLGPEREGPGVAGNDLADDPFPLAVDAILLEPAGETAGGKDFVEGDGKLFPLVFRPWKGL